MDTQRLKALAADPTLVPAIYSYCDRWCERCAFTARCLNFKWEAETRSPSNGKEPTPEETMDDVAASLGMAVDLMREIAAEEGVDFEALQAEAEAAPPRESVLQRACGVGADEISSDPHGLVFPAPDPATVEYVAVAAFGYARTVNAWFESAESALRAKADELTRAAHAGLPGVDPVAEGCRIHEWLEIIRYYQHFIAIKLVRAVSGVKETEDWPDAGDATRDADGSAKAALLAMDRSGEAWRGLSESLPEEKAATRDLGARLERLCEETEVRFPAARDFVRPGLDEGPTGVRR